MKIKSIALVAPSGNIKNTFELNEKIKILKKFFKVKKYYNENSVNGYLSDTDENRIQYFQNAFLDDEVDMVLAIRGGYGAIRIVDYINYNLIKNSSKIYCAGSDSTILLMALYKYTRINCIHSLMLLNGFLDNINENIDIIENNKFNIDLTPINDKHAHGILWGGNLSSIVSVISDDKYIPNDNIILFLEDLNEPLYKIDKMFFEIYRNKKLREKIKGIIFGDFYLDDNEIMPLLIEYSKKFNVATFLNKNITHKKTNIILQYGYNLSI